VEQPVDSPVHFSLRRPIAGVRHTMVQKAIVDHILQESHEVRRGRGDGAAFMVLADISRLWAGNSISRSSSTSRHVPAV